MMCRQCWEAIPGDWVEWKQRHLLNLGDHGEAVQVESVVLCAPPRVCAQEYATSATERAAEANREAVAGLEPF